MKCLFGYITDERGTKRSYAATEFVVGGVALESSVTLAKLCRQYRAKVQPKDSLVLRMDSDWVHGTFTGWQSKVLMIRRGSSEL